MGVECKTFIREDCSLIPLDEFAGRLDPENMEGSIELVLDNTCVLNRNMWDVVDGLWGVIVNGLDELSDDKSHRGWFPDQPVDILFEPSDGNKIIFTVVVDKPLSVKIDRKCFMSRMIQAAEEFFVRVNALVGGDEYYLSAIQRITEIKDREKARYISN